MTLTITKFVIICIGNMVSGLVDEAKHREAYGHLLNSIVKLNEKRMDAMIKLHNLQQYNVATKLRIGRDVTPDSNDDQPVLVLFMDEKSDLRSKSKKNPISESVENVKTTLKKNKENKRDDDIVPNDSGNLKIDKEDKTLLRKSWRSSCDKQAQKKCTKACCNAYKNVCTTYKCKSKQKKKFKKECKRSCKAKFRDASSGSSSSSSSD